jgi:hypothetical protein
LRTDYVLEAKVPILELKHETHSPPPSSNRGTSSRAAYFFLANFWQMAKQIKWRNLGVFSKASNCQILNYYFSDALLSFSR